MMWHECAERIQTAREGYSLVFCGIRWHHRGVLMNDESRVCEVVHRGEWSPPLSLVSVVVHFQLLCKLCLWNKMQLFFAVGWLFWCLLALLIDSSLAVLVFSFWSGKHAVSWFLWLLYRLKERLHEFLIIVWLDKRTKLLAQPSCSTFSW